MLKKFLGVLGGLTCLSSLVFVSAAVGDLIVGSSDTEPGILVGLLIFFSGTALASGFLAKHNLWATSQDQQNEKHSHETIILELAMQRGS